MDHELTITAVRPLIIAQCLCGWKLDEKPSDYYDGKPDDDIRNHVRYEYGRHMEKVNTQLALEKFRTLSQQIAQSLPGWSYDDRDYDEEDNWKNNFTYLKGPDGACISLHYQSREKRISVSGEYPNSGGNTFPYRDKQASSITVSPEREPSVIAKDIQRRFIAPYLEAYKLGRQQYEQHTNHLVAKQKLLNRLAAACGVKPSDSKFSIHYYGGQNTNGYFDLTVDGEDSVRMDLRSVPGKTAEKVVKLIVAS